MFVSSKLSGIFAVLLQFVFWLGLNPAFLFSIPFILLRNILDKQVVVCIVSSRKKKGISLLIPSAPSAVHGWKKHFLFVSKISGEAWDFVN